METTRQQKFAKLIQKELGEIFQREATSLTGVQAMVTITGASSSPDLSYVKVFISIFPSSARKEGMKNIQSMEKEIRLRLGTRIRKQVRHIPEVHFILDESLDHAENIERLLGSIDIPPALPDDLDSSDYK